MLDFGKTIWTTDNGANMKAALSHDSLVIWVSCAVHDLNLAIENGFKDLKKTNSPLPTLVESAAQLVKYSKKSKYIY